MMVAGNDRPGVGRRIAKQHGGGRHALRGQGEKQQPEEYFLEPATHGRKKSP